MLTSRVNFCHAEVRDFCDLNCSLIHNFEQWQFLIFRQMQSAPKLFSFFQIQIVLVPYLSSTDIFQIRSAIVGVPLFPPNKSGNIVEAPYRCSRVIRPTFLFLLRPNLRISEQSFFC